TCLKASTPRSGPPRTGYVTVISEVASSSTRPRFPGIQTWMKRRARALLSSIDMDSSLAGGTPASLKLTSKCAAHIGRPHCPAVGLPGGRGTGPDVSGKSFRAAHQDKALDGANPGAPRQNRAAMAMSQTRNAKTYA